MTATGESVRGRGRGARVMLNLGAEKVEELRDPLGGWSGHACPVTRFPSVVTPSTHEQPAASTSGLTAGYAVIS